MAIFHRYDPDMLAASCDEGYLNITNYCNQHNVTAAECVSEMRRIVQEETKLTVSAGIAPNKVSARSFLRYYLAFLTRRVFQMLAKV